jgi:hypothetical protein
MLRENTNLHSNAFYSRLVGGNMMRKSILYLFVLLLMAATGIAQEGDNMKGAIKDEASDAKALSGMSIVGNDEAPKSLYIVPWKSSELGVETSLNAMLNEGDMPVDRDVFERQLEFYRISRGDATR